MARKLRLKYEGAIYHVTVRGNARRRIFRDDADRKRLLQRLSESSELYEVRIYLFCLMDNHFHLVLETPRANISRFMQSLLTGYTVYFNLRHNTCGHLLQGRYGAELVEGDNYLLNLSRYVHLNPVFTREHKTLSLKEKVSYLRRYPWSSYPGYTNKKKRHKFLECGPTLGLLTGPKKEREKRYQRFVETGFADTEDEFHELMKSKIRSIGSRDFRKWVDQQYKQLKEEIGKEEDVSFRREERVFQGEEVLEMVADAFEMQTKDLRVTQYRSLARPVAALMLCKHAGMTQREAGLMLGYRTGAAVCMQLKKLQELTVKDKRLASQIRRIEKKVTKG